MLKEIHEQPKGVRETIANRLDSSGQLNLAEETSRVSQGN